MLGEELERPPYKSLYAQGEHNCCKFQVMSKIVLLMNFQLSGRISDHYVPIGPIGPSPVVLLGASQDGLVVWVEGAATGVQEVLSTVVVARVSIAIGAAGETAATGIAVAVDISGTRLISAPSDCMQSMHQWLSYTRPSGAFGTLGTLSTLGILSTTLTLEGVSPLQKPLKLLSLSSINYHSTISPPPLLLQAPLIMCSVLLTLATSLCGALGVVVLVMSMFSLQCHHHHLHQGST